MVLLKIAANQWSTEAGKIRKYQIPKLRYSNRTEPNLILVEEITVPSFMFNFPLFIVFFVTFFTICCILLHFSGLKKEILKKRVVF